MGAALRILPFTGRAREGKDLGTFGRRNRVRGHSTGVNRGYERSIAVFVPGVIRNVANDLHVSRDVTGRRGNGKVHFAGPMDLDPTREIVSRARRGPGIPRGTGFRHPRPAEARVRSAAMDLCSERHRIKRRDLVVARVNRDAGRVTISIINDPSEKVAVRVVAYVDLDVNVDPRTAVPIVEFAADIVAARVK